MIQIKELTINSPSKEEIINMGILNLLSYRIYSKPKAYLEQIKQIRTIMKQDIVRNQDEINWYNVR